MFDFQFTPEEALIPCVKLYTREEWGALPPTSIEPMETPVPYISLTYIKPKGKIENVQNEMEGLRDLQLHQMEQEGMPDIQSNFFVGKDGSVFEGRGWSVKPSCGEYSTLRQRQHRGKFLEITFIHDYLTEPDKNPLLKVTSEIIREGIRRKYIRRNFTFLENMVLKKDGSSMHTMTLTPSYNPKPTMDYV